MIKKEYPDLSLTASTLMDIHTPVQLTMLDELFDTIVPSGKILRNREVLQSLRNGFRGKIRLLVNEACLPGCVHRTQHFYEMGPLAVDHPASLCNQMLDRHPWLRLTGAWILPQFLDLYDGLYDEFKLAGRITLQDPEKYMHVLSHYVERRDLMPYEIGGGPASPPPSVNIEKEFFKYTLGCAHNCDDCSYCREYWIKVIRDKADALIPDKESQSGKKKENRKPDRIDQIIRQYEKDLPDTIDMEKIRTDWKKIPLNYKYWEKEMPSPEWKEQGLLHSPSECWDVLMDKTNGQSSKPISVYVHVPFCDRRCNFCDCQSVFVSKRNSEIREDFTRLLIDEIKQWATLPGIPDRKVTTIHFGGGTPNYLPIENLISISHMLKEELNVTDQTELALESTSTLISKEHLQDLSEMGFKRLHVGVQTLNDAIRKRLGRRDRAYEVMEKLDTALKMGFIVSVDIILGLPGQNIHSLLDTLAQLIKCGLHGLSLYHLNISVQNQKFFDNLKGFERDLLHDYFLFQTADQYLMQQGCRKNHFVHYAREEDKNLYYNHARRGEDLLALGPTADGFFEDYFYLHKWIEEYLSHGDPNQPSLAGGNHISKAALKLRPLKSQLMCSAVSPNLVNKLGRSKLFDQWLEYGFIRKLNGVYSLTGTGSWFISKMVAALMKNGNY
jgi:oxygen-independent coproporphyrinogen-3 oxidase